MSGNQLRGRLADIARSARRAAGPLAYARLSYSQEGEDLVLDRMFSDGRPGVYVDVGAHHPFRFSNTYLFYRRGWCGINVDANPGSMRQFHRWRRRDVNLEVGIARAPGVLTYHAFKEPALNTFDPALAARRRESGDAYLGSQIIDCMPLAEVIRRHPFVLGVQNSFLSVDVEGLDLEVLKSSDWNLFRPAAVVAEILDLSVAHLFSTEVVRYLESVGYVLVSRLANSCVFHRSDW